MEMHPELKNVSGNVTVDDVNNIITATYEKDGKQITIKIDGATGKEITE